MRLRQRMTIWGGSDGGRHLCDQLGEVLVTGLAEMHFIANPMG
jgi:hypothetical protein